MPRCWLLIAALAGPLLAGPAGRAETGVVVVVTLQDGEQLEGVIRQETDQELVLETSQAGGTIIQSRTFARTNITAIAPLSPEVLRQRELAVAYERVRHYQLSPLTSYSVAYYSQVISNVFRPFLERYPDAPQADVVAEQLAIWQVERERVTGGQARYRGRWLAAAEVARLITEAEAARLLSLARRQLANKQFEPALRTLNPLTTPEARTLQQDICRQWVETADTERARLQSQLTSQQARLDRAEAALAKAQLAARGSTSLRTTRTDGRLGSAQKPMENLLRAQNEVRAAARLVAETERQLQAMDNTRRLAAGQARMFDVEVAAGPGSSTGAETAATTAASAPPEDYSSPSVLGATAEFGRKYWPLGLLALLVIVLVVNRVFGR